MPARRHRHARALLATVLGAGLIAASATASGPITRTIAGNGTQGFAGDNAPASGAAFNTPRRMAESPTGILVADTFNHRVRELRWDGSVVTVAGTGVPGRLGDGGQATAAQLNEPASVASLPGGGFLIADRANGRIRRVGPEGGITTIAGGVSNSGDDDDDAADRTTARHDDEDDDDDNGPAIQYPQDVAPAGDGRFLIADSHADVVFSLDGEGRVRTVAGTGRRGFRGDGGPARDARLDEPRGVVATPDGGMLIADSGNHRVRRVGPDGRIFTVAGNGTDGSTGDGGPAGEAQLRAPVGLSIIPQGGFLIADRDDSRVRRVSPAGIIDTAAGTGVPGYNGEALAPTDTQLNGPRGVLAFADGRILIADSANHRIRLVGPEDAPAATEQGTPASVLPPPVPPVAGKRLNVGTATGRIFVKTPGADSYVELNGAASIPVGSLIDASRGSVRLTSAANLKGGKQTAIFSRGAFAVRQKRERRPVTDLVLRGGDFSSCKRPSAKHSALVNASRRRARRGLWGRGHGRFRTRGRHGAATVRGTIWFTQDRCDGTLVRVKRGVVSVKDFSRKRPVLVPAGRKYLARAHRAR